MIVYCKVWDIVKSKTTQSNNFVIVFIFHFVVNSYNLYIRDCVPVYTSCFLMNDVVKHLIFSFLLSVYNITLCSKEVKNNLTSNIFYCVRRVTSKLYMTSKPFVKKEVGLADFFAWLTDSNPSAYPCHLPLHR